MKRKSVYRAATILLTVGASLLLVYSCANSLYNMLRAWYEGFAYEYRAFAGIDVTNHILAGENLYLTETVAGMKQPLVYVYPILQPLLAALIALLPLISSVDAHFIIAFASFFGMLVVVWFVGRKRQFRPWLILLGGVLFATISPNSRFFPGALALAVSLCIFLLVFEDRKRTAPLLAALLVILFFTKQYFVAYLLPVSIYLLFRNRKVFLRFLLWLVGEGAAILLLTKCFFPNYFLNSVFITKFSTESSVEHLLNQLGVLGQKYGLLLGVTALLLVIFFTAYRKMDEDENKRFIQFCLIVFLSNFLCSLYFAQNEGARYTYIQELCVPALAFLLISLIHTVFCRQKDLIENLDYRKIVAFGAIMVLIICSLVGIFQWRKRDRLSAFETVGFREIREMVAEHGANGETIFLSPETSHLSMAFPDYDILYDDGQLEFAISSRLKNEGMLGKLYYARALEETQYADSFVNGLSEKIANSEFGLIVLSEYEYLLNRGLIEQNYECIRDIDVYSCTDHYRNEIWVRKKPDTGV